MKFPSSKMTPAFSLIVCTTIALLSLTNGTEDAKMPGYGADGGQGGYGDAMQGGYGGGPKQPQCPTGQTGVTKRGYRAYGNGCGTGGIKVSSEFDFEECCTYTHDVCYVTCGMEKSRCEELFGECMAKICKDKFGDRQECKSNAGMYTMGTTMMGAKYYKEGQDEACDCIPNDKVDERRLEELTEFYKEWAPDQDGKAKGLYAKYKDNFPRLRLMLNQKYKDSVKVIERNDDGTAFNLNVKSHDSDSQEKKKENEAVSHTEL